MEAEIAFQKMALTVSLVNLTVVMWSENKEKELGPKWAKTKNKWVLYQCFLYAMKYLYYLGLQTTKIHDFITSFFVFIIIFTFFFIFGSEVLMS